MAQLSQEDKACQGATRNTDLSGPHLGGNSLVSETVYTTDNWTCHRNKKQKQKNKLSSYNNFYNDGDY